MTARRGEALSDHERHAGRPGCGIGTREKSGALPDTARAGGVRRPIRSGSRLALELFDQFRAALEHFLRRADVRVLDNLERGAQGVDAVLVARVTGQTVIAIQYDQHVRTSSFIPVT